MQEIMMIILVTLEYLLFKINKKNGIIIMIKNLIQENMKMINEVLPYMNFLLRLCFKLN